ncbi:MAG: type VI secretion system-associated protein TagO [Rhodothermales bacterium]
MKATGILFALLVALTAPAYSQPADSLGLWRIQRGVQAQKGVTSITATLEAREAQRFLGVRCENQRTYAFIAWNDRVGASPRVGYQIGDEAPLEKVWNTSSEGTASFVPGRTIEFLNRIARHDSLRAQATLEDGTPITAVFDLNGIDYALQPIREACRW